MIISSSGEEKPAIYVALFIICNPVFEVSELIYLCRAMAIKPDLYFYRVVVGNLYGNFLPDSNNN